MPVVSLAQWKEIPEDKMVRAVTLSNLIAIRIKSKFGRLSAMCGASVAGTGAGLRHYIPWAAATPKSAARSTT